jgi:putative membrane protein
MKYVLWVVKFALFAFMLTFALKNTDAVTLRYFLGHEWRAPLIFVLLVVFCVGAAVGLLSTLGQLLRQRRQISGLKRELAASAQRAAEASPPDVAAP